LSQPSPFNPSDEKQVEEWILKRTFQLAPPISFKGFKMANDEVPLRIEGKEGLGSKMNSYSTLRSCGRCYSILFNRFVGTTLVWRRLL
jgi:hypothetical protein